MLLAAVWETTGRRSTRLVCHGLKPLPGAAAVQQLMPQGFLGGGACVSMLAGSNSGMCTECGISIHITVSSVLPQPPSPQTAATAAAAADAAMTA
jgi:hypothetical protein